MPKGQIKKLVRDKGFGFISSEGSKDIFFHRTNLVDCEFDALREDQGVEFDVEESPKGQRAVNVRIA